MGSISILARLPLFIVITETVRLLMIQLFVRAFYLVQMREAPEVTLSFPHGSAACSLSADDAFYDCVPFCDPLGAVFQLHARIFPQKSHR